MARPFSRIATSSRFGVMTPGAMLPVVPTAPRLSTDTNVAREVSVIPRYRDYKRKAEDVSYTGK